MKRIKKLQAEVKYLAEVLYDKDDGGADRTAEARYYEITAELFAILARRQSFYTALLLISQMLLVALLLKGIAAG